MEQEHEASLREIGEAGFIVGREILGNLNQQEFLMAGQLERRQMFPNPIRLARMVNEIGRLVTVSGDPVGPHPARLDGEQDSQALGRRSYVARQSSSPTRQARGGRGDHR